MNVISNCIRFDASHNRIVKLLQYPLVNTEMHRKTIQVGAQFFSVPLYSSIHLTLIHALAIVNMGVSLTAHIRVIIHSIHKRNSVVREILSFDYVTFSHRRNLHDLTFDFARDFGVSVDNILKFEFLYIS